MRGGHYASAFRRCFQRAGERVCLGAGGYRCARCTVPIVEAVDGRIKSRKVLMHFDHFRRAALLALLFATTLSFIPTMARAEVITLQCLFTGAPAASGQIVVIDLSARTAIAKGIAENSGIMFNLTNVAISESAFSFVRDIPGVSRVTSKIDRTNGSIVTEVYNYPGGGMSGTSRGTGQCTKIPNRAF